MENAPSRSSPTASGDSPKGQDIRSELEFQAHEAEAAGEAIATPPEVIQRYRETRAWRYYYKECVFHEVKRLKPRHICDFGCGAGETSTELGAIGFTVTGFDLSPELIQIARRRAELDRVTDCVTFHVGNAHEVKLNQGFDLILVQAVLHHIVDLTNVLEEIGKLVPPGGHVIIQEPVALSPLLQALRDLTPVPKHISPNERQLTQVDMDKIESSFEVLERRSFYGFSRLHRLIPSRPAILGRLLIGLLARLDWFLFGCIPGMSRFAGIVVLVCRKR